MSLISASLCSKLLRLSPRFLNSLPNQTNPSFLHQSKLIPPSFRSLRFSIMEGDSGFANNGGLSPARTSPVSNGGEPGVSQFRLSPTSLLKIRMGDITRWSVDGVSDAIVLDLNRIQSLVVVRDLNSVDTIVTLLGLLVHHKLSFMVNPANERMLGGGGADGAIHRAAGPELRAACYDVPEVERGVRCPTGEARITPGFRLPASHVIHTVGPIYDVDRNPEASLRSAYRNSLRVARENNIQYVAFPAISCGVYGYPYNEAATVAISSVREFGDDIKEVHFVLFSDDIYDVWLNKAEELLQNQN